MDIIADLHTHTLASTHAFSTATEMINAAKEKNLQVLALTDHGRTMPDAPGAYYFESLHAIPKYVNGVRVLKGIEANISDYNGNLDVSDKLLDSLDWVVASMHMVTLPGAATVEKCTNAYLQLAKNKNVNVIGHSGTPYFYYDYEKVIPVLAENNILIEINNNSFLHKKDSINNCIKIIMHCRKIGARICVNSDAHYLSQVGSVDDTISILKELNFPKELVVNSSMKNLTEYFKQCNITL